MAWSTIRKATQEDHDKLEARARAFIARHDLDTLLDAESFPQNEAVWALEDHLGYYSQDANSPCPQHIRYLLSLWKRIVKRALGHCWAEGIAYGYVGFSAN